MNKYLLARRVGTIDIGLVAQGDQMGLQIGPGCCGLRWIQAGLAIGVEVVEHDRDFGHERKCEQLVIAIAHEPGRLRQVPAEVGYRILLEQLIEGNDFLVLRGDLRRVVVIELDEVGLALFGFLAGFRAQHCRLTGKSAQNDLDVALLFVELLRKLLELGCIMGVQGMPDQYFYGIGAGNTGAQQAGREHGRIAG